MAKPAPFYLFKETRLDIEPPAPDSTVILRLPAHGGARQTPRTAQRRIQLNDLPAAEDETAFSKRHLAVAGSIYFRANQVYPRSFLWRVLEDRTVLEIQPADLSRSELDKQDRASSLRFCFPNTISPAGVSFSDSTDHEILYVFVLTSRNELYTLELRPSFFHGTTLAGLDTGLWCKTYLPNSFNFRYPHRLVARSPQELLISLHDGGLLRMTRELSHVGEHGSNWNEAFYSDGPWTASLRGLIPWKGHGTVRYGNVDLDSSTTTSIAFSPEGSHFFTVCLNHRLKAWNFSTGKVGFSADLLNKERLPQENNRYKIDPAESDLVQIFKAEGLRDGDLYYLVTFSPVGAGQVKFWAVRDPDVPELGISDLFPDSVLEPPEPPASPSEIWKLAKFRVRPASNGSGVEMFVLWKNNNSYRLQKLACDLFELPEHWSKPWIATAAETLDDQPFPLVSDQHSVDVTEEWLDRLFYPGRFTSKVLETSLSIYRSNLTSTPPNPLERKTKSLKERICLAVAPMVALSPTNHDEMDYERYRVDVDSQWRRFWRLAMELDKRRREALTFAYDDYTDLPWIVGADTVTVIRQCSQLEMIWHNPTPFLQSEQDVIPQSVALTKDLAYTQIAGLLNASMLFVDSFSDALLFSCRSVLLSELFQNPSFSVPVRLRSFYDQCDFANQVGDDEYNLLMNAISHFGGLKSLNNELFLAILEMLPLTHAGTRSDTYLRSTSLGLKVLVKGSQEMISLGADILFQLLLVVVFLDVEVDREEEQMDGFTPARLYAEILSLLKEYEILKWLVKTERREPNGQDTAEMMDTDSVTQATHSGQISTLFENLFAATWKPTPTPHQPHTTVLTNSISQIISGVTRVESLDSVTIWILCNLIKHNNLDAASEFLLYLPDNAWSTYVQGRLYLSQGDYTLAALHFKKPAFVLASGKHKNVGYEESDGLIGLTELDSFNNGLAMYYLHILSLFERKSAHSYVQEFASLALQFSSTPNDKSLQSEILSRQFYAAVRTSRFSEAYSALVRYSDKALQKASIVTLVKEMVSQSQIAQFLELPFTGLHHVVDETLWGMCQKVLNIYSGPAFHKVLYAWRLSRNDLRGAAEVLHDRLQRLQESSARGPGKEDTVGAYLDLINVMATMDPKQAWILVTRRASTTKGRSTTSGTNKRQVLTLEVLRREYQDELDRLDMIENNQFALVGFGDEMDIL